MNKWDKTLCYITCIVMGIALGMMSGSYLLGSLFAIVSIVGIYFLDFPGKNKAQEAGA